MREWVLHISTFTHISHSIFAQQDIVDTVMSNGRDLVGDTLVKALTGAINRRQDRMGEKGRKLR